MHAMFMIEIKLSLDAALCEIKHGLHLRCSTCLGMCKLIHGLESNDDKV